eukprot:XP_001694319.1 predicted protein [Chlamydomonas reinhardtii]
MLQLYEVQEDFFGDGLKALGAAALRRHRDAAAAELADVLQGSSAWMAAAAYTVQPLLDTVGGCEAAALRLLCLLQQQQQQQQPPHEDEPPPPPQQQQQQRRTLGWDFVDAWDEDWAAGAATYLAGRLASEAAAAADTAVAAAADPATGTAASAAAAAAAASAAALSHQVGELLCGACAQAPAVALALAGHARLLGVVAARAPGALGRVLDAACEAGREEVVLQLLQHQPLEQHLLRWLGSSRAAAAAHGGGVHWDDARVAALARQAADWLLRREGEGEAAAAAAAAASETAAAPEAVEGAGAAAAQPPPKPKPPPPPPPATGLAEALLAALDCSRAAVLEALTAHGRFLAAALAQMPLLTATPGGGERLGAALVSGYRRPPTRHMAAAVLSRRQCLDAAVAHAPGQLGAVLSLAIGSGRMQDAGMLVVRPDLLDALVAGGEECARHLVRALDCAATQRPCSMLEALLSHAGFVGFMAATEGRAEELGEALEAACRTGHGAAVRLMVGSGGAMAAVLGRCPCLALSAFLQACERGNAEAVAAMAGHGPLLAAFVARAPQDLGKGLARACEHHHGSVVRVLLRQPAYLAAAATHAVEQLGEALRYAAAVGKGECVRLLVGSDVFMGAVLAGARERAGLAFQQACGSGCEEAVAALLAHGPLMAALVAHAPEQLGEGLVAACARGRPAVVQMLLAHGGLAAAVRGHAAPLLLEAVARAREYGHVSLVQALVEYRLVGGAARQLLPAAVQLGSRLRTRCGRLIRTRS